MKPFLQLSGILGFLLCLGLSSCGRLSPSLNTNYGRVIATSEAEKEQVFNQKSTYGQTLLFKAPQ